MISDVKFQVAPQFIRPTSSLAASGSAAARLPEKSVQKEDGAVQSGNVLPEAELPRIVGELEELVQAVRRELRFSVEENSGRTVITVIDAETQSVIRQIPPEEVLTIMDRIRSLDGGLVEERA